jgi:hypothetical protein
MTSPEAATTPGTLPIVRTWVNARLLVIAAAGVSAGIHAGLTPQHYEDSPPIGVLFVLAAIALTLTAAVLAIWPDAGWPPLAGAALFAALLVSYVLFREDSFDALAAVTKAVEAVGLALSLWLLRTKPATRPGDLALAYFGFSFVLALTIAAGGHGHGQ